MNGAGNDFIMLNNRSSDLVLTAGTINRLCDRENGIGADGVIILEESTKDAISFRMRFYNSDGLEVEMCGNGARCFARYIGYLSDQPLVETRFHTMNGIISATILNDERVRLKMSRPFGGKRLNDCDFHGVQYSTAYFINTGVPHVVLEVDDIQTVDVQSIGCSVRHDASFTPNGTNVSFFQVVVDVDCESLLIRTYERGVEGETLACGTGAVAVAMIHAERRDWYGSRASSVQVRSGDILHVGFCRIESYVFENVTLEGPATFDFEGQIKLELLEALV